MAGAAAFFKTQFSRGCSGLRQRKLFRDTLAAVVGEMFGTCLLTLGITTSVAVAVIAGIATLLAVNFLALLSEKIIYVCLFFFSSL